MKRPRRLFQTWSGGPSICLNRQYIWGRHFLRKDFFSFYWTSCILPSHLKFIMPQINVWWAYSQLPLSDRTFIQDLLFNRENTVPNKVVIVIVGFLFSTGIKCSIRSRSNPPWGTFARCPWKPGRHKIICPERSQHCVPFFYLLWSW